MKIKQIKQQQKPVAGDNKNGMQFFTWMNTFKSLDDLWLSFVKNLDSFVWTAWC